MDPKFLARFVAHCKSYVQNIKTVVLVISVLLMLFLKEKKLYCRTYTLP